MASKIESTSRIVVIFVFTVSLCFPLIFKYVGPYAAPTAVNAIHILEKGTLTNGFLLESHKYWRSALECEVEFPVPSLLLSMLISLTNLPKEYAMFIPISGIANVMYFVLAKSLLFEWRKNKNYAPLLSALYYAFITFQYIYANYTGRAVLGVTFLTYFLFCYLKLLHKSLTGYNVRSWTIMSLLFTLVIGYTYYTSLLAIIVVTLLMLIMLNIVALLGRKPSPSYLGITCTVLASFLLIHTSLLDTITGRIKLESFANNVFEYVKMRLSIEAKGEAWQLYAGLVEVDFLTRTLTWFTFAITIASIISVVAAIFMYKPRIKYAFSFKNIWLFSLITLLSSLAEFFYLFIIPTAPIRFLSIYGPITLLFTIIRFIHKPNLGCARRVRARTTIITMILIMAISLSCIGSLKYSWYYGEASAKPLAYYEIQPVSEFLLAHSSSARPIIVTGDAYYTANLFFITSLCNKVNYVIPEPLGKDAITLYHSILTGCIEDFFVSIRSRGILYLLMVRTTRPLWGDGWGYAVSLPNFDVIASQANLMYEDGYSQIYY